MVIAEGPALEGHQLAASLPKAAHGNIAVTLVPDSAIYAIMSRVNKVQCGTTTGDSVMTMELR